MIPLPYFLYFRRKNVTVPSDATIFLKALFSRFLERYTLVLLNFPGTSFGENQRENFARLSRRIRACLGRFRLFLNSTSLTSLAISLCLNSFEHYHRHGPRLSIGHANQYVSVLNFIFNYYRASCDKLFVCFFEIAFF